MKTWSVYLLRCADGSLYCGVTTDPARRLRQHSAGTASKYTRSRLPLKEFWYASGLSMTEALCNEARIKSLRNAELKTAALMLLMNKYKCGELKCST